MNCFNQSVLYHVVHVTHNDRTSFPITTQKELMFSNKQIFFRIPKETNCNCQIESENDIAMSIKVLKEIVEQDEGEEEVIKAGDVNVNKFLEEVRNEDAKWGVKQWTDQQIESIKVFAPFCQSFWFN
jgi:hypothetical protein